jgi:hypothetical protein
MHHTRNKLPTAEVQALIGYARTENQRTILEAIVTHGGVTEVAKLLGVPRNTVGSVVTKARAQRDQHLASHKLPIRPEVPADHRLKGVSTLGNGDGSIDQQWVKTERDSFEPVSPIIRDGFDIDGVSSFTDAQGNVRAQWIRTSPKERDKLALLTEAAEQACEAFAGKVKPTKAPGESEAGTMSVYGLGDPHIGMLSYGVETGQNFDLKIAVEQTSAVVSRLVACAPPSEVGLLALIGDNYHADDDRQVTPGHGHKLDVDGRAPKVFRVGCSLWLAQIRCMLTKHKRVIVNVTRGNHDPLTSFFMAEWLRAMFKDEPRVEILDNIAEHQYILFGRCLLGLTHGHKTKPEGLAGVMAADVPEMWAQAIWRHWLTGHIHSKTHHDFRGCSLETLRTLAAQDAYAAGAGYRSSQSSIVLTLHENFGEIGRATVNLARAGIEIARKPRGYTVELRAVGR